MSRAVGHVADKEILTVNAALGHRELDYEGSWVKFPDVPPPDECRPMPTWEGAEGTIHGCIELRAARGRFGREANGRPTEDGQQSPTVIGRAP